MKISFLSIVVVVAMLLSACSGDVGVPTGGDNNVGTPDGNSTNNQDKYDVVEITPTIPSDKNYHYSDGIIRGYYNNKVFYLDSNGKELIAPEKYSDGDLFNEGIAIVYKNTTGGVSADSVKMFAIDRTGNELFSMVGSYASNFNNGKVVMNPVVDKRNANYYAVVDKSGNTLFTIQKDRQNVRSSTAPSTDIGQIKSIAVSCGRFIGSVSTFYGGVGDIVVYDENGNQISLPFEPKGAHEKYSDNLLAIKDGNGKWGSVDVNGNLKIRCEYEELGDAGDGLIPYLKYGKWGYIDYNGNTVIEAKYVKAGSFSNGLAAVVDESKQVSYIDTKGSVVISDITTDSNSADYYSMDSFKFYDSGYAIANNMLIDKNGIVIFEGWVSYYGGDLFFADNGKIYKIVKNKL